MGRNTPQDPNPGTPDPTPGTPDLSPFVESLLAVGTTLKQEKADLTERVKSNRDMLRALDKQGSVSDEQREKIKGLYPRAEKNADASADAPAGGDESPPPTTPDTDDAAAAA